MSKNKAKRNKMRKDFEKKRRMLRNNAPLSFTRGRPLIAGFGLIPKSKKYKHEKIDTSNVQPSADNSNSAGPEAGADTKADQHVPDKQASAVKEGI